MAGKALAWLAVLGLVGPVAGAQEVLGGDRGTVDEQRLPEDIPDNMDEFRQTPQSDDSPVTLESEEGTGGSGLAGTGEEGELYGEVVNVRGDQLWLRHGGAVFPLELTEDTRFSPDRRQALQAGQEVRARFTLEEDGYVVNALEPVKRDASGQKSGTEQREAPER
jgi:hypothetical protein